MPISETNAHLRGPWVAVLADDDGAVYATFDDALTELGEDWDSEMTIRVVRGTALPIESPTDEALRLPGSYQTGDVALDMDDVWLVDPDDASIGAEARYLQAQAMADGLNAAASACPHGHPGGKGCGPCSFERAVGDTRPSLTEGGADRD